MRPEPLRATMGLSWLRWAAFAPIALALHQSAFYVYRPVGAFLGGYFPAWTYMLAALLFMFVATFLGVTVAIAIVPSRQKSLGIIVGVGFIVLDYFSLKAPASTSYMVAWVLFAILGAAIAYFVVIGVLDAISSESSNAVP
jgi:hypothetical protein